MNYRILCLALVSMLGLGLVGCGPKHVHSHAPRDSRVWKLANGTEFSVTVNDAYDEHDRSWIWCDLAQGDISYRIVGNGKTSDWKPMTKILVSKDEKMTITPDPDGMFGDAVVLPRGNYSVEFKVGTEEFSSVALNVD